MYGAFCNRTMQLTNLLFMNICVYFPFVLLLQRKLPWTSLDTYSHRYVQEFLWKAMFSEFPGMHSVLSSCRGWEQQEIFSHKQWLKGNRRLIMSPLWGRGAYSLCHSQNRMIFQRYVCWVLLWYYWILLNSHCLILKFMHTHTHIMHRHVHKHVHILTDTHDSYMSFVSHLNTCT